MFERVGSARIGTVFISTEPDIMGAVFVPFRPHCVLVMDFMQYRGWDGVIDMLDQLISGVSRVGSCFGCTFVDKHEIERVA
jgi:hypothetical protein